MNSPIIVGGNGHSGTRIFAEVLIHCGINMGVRVLSYDRNSKDLNIRGLMNRWMKPYLLGLSDERRQQMEREFKFRLRLLLPRRSQPWGFKNPRSMFLLPFYHTIYPDMKFIHVIRDGRDMCFGNPFVDSPTYWGVISNEEIRRLTKEEIMMKFWGEGNGRVKRYGESELGDRYLRVRFEDLCHNTKTEMHRIIEFAGGSSELVSELALLVKVPKSIGRWKTYDPGETEKALAMGENYLAEFGYT